MSNGLEKDFADSIDNKELLPSDEASRTLSTVDLLILCSCMVVNVVGLVIPAQVLLKGGYSPIDILAACFFGFFLVTCLIILTGDIGTKYGVPFAVIIRDCFGKQGAKIGAVCRAIVCLTWCGIQLYLATAAINAIFTILTGISAFWIIFVIYACMQLFNASRNVKSMSHFGKLAMPILAVGLISLVVWLLKSNDISLPEVLSATPLPGEGFSFITIIAIFSGGWLSEALNGSDLTRKLKVPLNERTTYFQRNKRTLIGFGIGFVGTGLLLTIAGLVCAYLTHNYDPVAMLQETFKNNPPILIASCLTIVFAQWSVNTCANIFPTTLILLNFFPKLTFAKATWLVGVISCAMMPWLLMAYLDYVQIAFSALLAPILAIMIVHYYIVNRGQLDLTKLYSNTMPNWKKPGLIALVCGLISGCLVPEFAFFAAFPIAGVVYYFFTIRDKKSNEVK